MRKQIAVFICAVSFDNQRRILDGILKRAKERDVDVFVFTGHIHYDADSATKQGVYNIMLLPDLSKFDGAIIVKNTIQYKPVADVLEMRIRTAKIPTVSIDEKIMNTHYVGISSYDAQRKVVEHMIKEHHMTKINYVTGQVTNEEGMGRYQAYRDVLKENNIPFVKDRVFYGNYAVECGNEAVHEFLKRDPELPEAIICANDAMAIGVMETLMELGYQVPDDVAIAGFDNDAMTKFYKPSITTIDRNQQEIAFRAVDIILDEQSEELQKHLIETKLLLHESCGCNNEQEYPVDELRETYTKTSNILQRATDCMKSMGSELACLESMSDLYLKIRNYMKFSDADSMYLCMCDEKQIFQEGAMGFESAANIPGASTKYSEKVSIPVAYHNGDFTSYGEFESGMVLPAESRLTEESSFYIVAPIYYKNYCFGYTVSRNSIFVMQSELFHFWAMNVGIAVENIRKLRLLSQMVKRLNGMWMYDMLTHVYNRSGFFYFSEKYLNRMKAENKQAFIIFLDLDGLKKINDNMGHEFGDRCIIEMAEILKESTQHNELVMRYGGDEFVVFGECRSEEDVKQTVELIKQNMQIHNSIPTRTFEVASSIGYSIYDANEIIDLSSLIEEADQRMYEEKREKRKKESQ